MKASLLLAGAVALGILVGCTHHTVEVKPVKVEPIHITIDVNIKIDKELDDFFDFEDEDEAES